MEKLHQLLAQRGYRLTTARKKVFEVLNTAEKPIATAGIVALSVNIDRVSVYRSIKLFSDLGIIKLIPVGWKRQYELTSPFKSHHHHILCTKCKKLTDLHSNDFEQFVTHLANTRQFTLIDHTFEIRGICKKCQKSHD